MKKTLVSALVFILVLVGVMLPWSDILGAKKTDNTELLLCFENMPPLPEMPRYTTLLAVGDNLIHSTVIREGRLANGGYDFNCLYQYISPYISAADIAYVNHESPMSNNIPATGYPKFNTPQENGDALRAAGFDIVNLANNHAMDSGTDALLDTIAYWQQFPEIALIGVADSEAAAQIKVTEHDGFSIAWLSYTYGSNYWIPNDWLVSKYDADAAKADIAAAKELADIVIVSMHWGTEYQTKEGARQREQAQYLADLGADLIIGHHPHVIQPAEWLTGADGNQTYCIYSLGNFISSQHIDETMLGGMLSVTFEADGDDVRIAEAGLIPIVTHYERGLYGYRTYLLKDYTEELANRHGIIAYEPMLTLQFLEDLADEVWGAERTEYDLDRVYGASYTDTLAAALALSPAA